MKVQQIRKFLEENPNAIVKFYRPSCPFCQYVQPLYNAAKNTYSDRVAFLAVDITSDADALKREFGFSTVPTFQYYKDGARQKQHGSNDRKLSQADITKNIQQLYL